MTSDAAAQGRPEDPELIGRLLEEVLELVDQVTARINDQDVEDQMRRVFDRRVREDLVAELDAKTARLPTKDDETDTRDAIPAGTFHAGHGRDHGRKRCPSAMTTLPAGRRAGVSGDSLRSLQACLLPVPAHVGGCRGRP
jgi:hypothetical protein